MLSNISLQIIYKKKHLANARRTFDKWVVLAGIEKQFCLEWIILLLLLYIKVQ